MRQFDVKMIYFCRNYKKVSFISHKTIEKYHLYYKPL